jgi:hypothetical protein
MQRLPPKMRERSQMILSLMPVGIGGAVREYRRALGHFVLRLIFRPLGDYSRVVIYRKDLTLPLTSILARVPIEVTQAIEADVPELLAVRPGYSEAMLKERFAAGARCFLARIGPRVVACNWYTTDALEDDPFDFSPGPGEIYCFDAFTAEEFRGHGIHGELLYRMLLDAQMSGCTVAYTWVETRNINSWKTHFRSGWEEFVLHSTVRWNGGATMERLAPRPRTSPERQLGPLRRRRGGRNATTAAN